MNYKDIEQYFETDDKLEGILEKGQEIFKKIDDISGKMRSGLLTTTIECSNTLQELSGIFAYLNPIYKIAETSEKDKFERAYMDIKKDMEANNEKFVSASGEKEASIIIKDYRRIAHIFEAYIEVCKVLIGSCQSLLKALTEEKNFTTN